MEFKSPYVSRPEVSRGLTATLPSMTCQQFAGEADVNYLIDRYKRTGSYYDPMSAVNGAPPRIPTFADISDLSDMQTSLETVFRAQEIFAALPAVLRERWNNNPAELVAYASDPAHEAELVKCGVLQGRLNETPEESSGPRGPSDISQKGEPAPESTPLV